MQVERFAEAAASHTLMPEGALHAAIGELGMSHSAWDIPSVRRVAKKFRLTPLATGAQRLDKARRKT